MMEDNDSRRSGKDRRSPPDRRQKQELFNYGKDKHEDRRSGLERRGKERRRTESDEQEW